MLSRIYLPGEIYFITTKTFKNQRIFDNDLVCKLFIKVLSDCRKKYKFGLYGYVVIPDHVHLLIMPDKDYTISRVIQKIKSIFAKELKKLISKRVAESLAFGGDSKTVAYAYLIEYGFPIWQKSFYDHIIRNDLDFEEKLEYIHGNPIKHGVIDNLDNYPWSSYQNYYLNNNNLIEIDYLDA